jgi:ribose/xylose/arabinose/galactoside ABC-type transport system permease subunit
VTPQQLRGAVEWAQRSGLFFGLILLGTYFAVSSSAFLTRPNLLVILVQVAIVGLIAVPGAMLVLAGYVDLSVGSMAVLASIIFGEMYSSGASVAAAVAVATAAGVLLGGGMGVLIAYLGFSPIIVTLGGFAGFRGLAELISKGETEQGFGDSFAFLGNGDVLGIPFPAVVMLVVFAIGGYLWYQMPIGRHMMAIGADKDAAHANGVPVRRIPTALYMASGGAAAVGGILMTAQLDGASLSIGQGMELQVLTAILLGGVSFTGGRGSLFGVLVGVLFVGMLQNGLVLLNVGPFYANVAIGAALVLAAGLDVVYQRLERVPVFTEGERTA